MKIAILVGEPPDPYHCARRPKVAIRQFADVLPSQSLGLAPKNESKHKAKYIRNKIYYNIKLTKKTKAIRSGRLLRPTARKRKLRNESILEGLDRQVRSKPLRK